MKTALAREHDLETRIIVLGDTMRTSRLLNSALVALIIAGLLLIGAGPIGAQQSGGENAEANEGERAATEFIEGVHYTRLDNPVPTVDSDKIEVIEAFSYGCPHCLELEPAVMGWQHRLPSNVDFRRLHAVWNDSMRLYAQAFYASIHMGIIDRVHVRFFNAIQIEQRALSSPRAFADFVDELGFDRDEFIRHFRSSETQQAIKSTEQRVALYQLSGVPQFIVNGKYKVDPARADGRKAMLDVVNHLIEKEREALKD